MKVTIFGTGYVGLVTGACLADVGNHVLCVDIDKRKIDMLQNGEIPIYEPGLDVIVERNIKHKTLLFTTDVKEGVAYGDFQFIAVGTPPDEDGSADLQYVLAVAKSIGEHMTNHKIIVDKSTVPVGTADKVRAQVQEELGKRNENISFDVVSNPEFLKEGAAIDDFMKPDRIVIGTESEKSEKLLKQLYAPFNRNHQRIIAMDTRSAELTKYAANAMLATKISLMNELSNLAELTGADIENVRKGIGSDPRIGYHFIYPGAGYGGSCFPKDVKALKTTAGELDYEAKILNSVEEVNEAQKRVLFDKLMFHYKGEIKGKTFAMWGLSFKPNTDDMRDASSRVMMELIWENGGKVKAHDPKAMEETKRIYGDRNDLELCDSAEDALEGTDALIVMTEWNVFRSPEFDYIKEKIADKVVFDGRNLYEPDTLEAMGLQYYAIGRGRNRYTA